MGLVVFLLLGVVVEAGELNLNVVYPKSDQNLPPVDSTFIFGSVEPGAHLSVNGHPVDVHKGGGWLAFVPINPGSFEFEVRAEKDGLIDSVTVPVNLPPLPFISIDSLYFVPGSFHPSRTLWVRPGDEIEISLRGALYNGAFCVIEPVGDTVFMRPGTPKAYYGEANAFKKDSLGLRLIPDSMLYRGLYRGFYIIPEAEADSLKLIHHMHPPLFGDPGYLMRFFETGNFPINYTFPDSLRPMLVDTSQVDIMVLDPNGHLFAETKDSLTIIRTGPGKGYLCIHQPAGIKAPIIGRDGQWIKLQLSEFQQGWVRDTSVVIHELPEETPPHSYISRLATENYQDHVRVTASTSDRHAFRVVENIREKSITVYLYGADSDTDWIRYDSSDDLIDHIVWFQDEPGVYGLKIYLNEENIWGYDGYYVDNQFRLDIKKAPRYDTEISEIRFVIDAGHAPDLGAVGPTGLTEKEANLAIALRLKEELEGYGAEVVLTRGNDTTLPLYDRPKIAVREKADIFISIHNNALPDGRNPFVNNGVSTYYYHPHSQPLANAVQGAMARNLGLNDFGSYYGNLAVNRPTQYPAILVECAFMMIPEQEALLRTAKFQRKIAQSIVEGIEDFLRGRPLSDWDRQQMESYGREK
ncbi:MAG: hypothetical protein GY841_02165 [FCB group bacterium]|nr:hypothetical protein [FCB group bacterium]